jgi:hypothetical protein
MLSGKERLLPLILRADRLSKVCRSWPLVL